MPWRGAIPFRRRELLKEGEAPQSTAVFLPFIVTGVATAPREARKQYVCVGFFLLV